MPLASLGDSFSSFFDAVGDFASNLAAVNWLSLLIALALFIGYLSLRALASFQDPQGRLSRGASSPSGTSGAPTWRATASTPSFPPAAATSCGCS